MSAQPQQYDFSKIFPLILDSWTAKTQPLIQLAQSQNAMETRPASRDLLLMQRKLRRLQDE